jgi:hypothetical protein
VKPYMKKQVGRPFHAYSLTGSHSSNQGTSCLG